jgi:DNA-binding NarL/FixJ family response regulator
VTLLVIERVVIASSSIIEGVGIASLVRKSVTCQSIASVIDFDALMEAMEPQTGMAFIDAGLPGFDNARQISRVRLRCPNAKLVVLSTGCDTETLIPFLDAGIEGYVPKQLGEAELVDAIRMIANGYVFLPSDLWREASECRAESALRSSGLSLRQEQVLALASKGYSNKEIGASLNIAESTVKVHISAALRAYGVRSRGRAVAAFSDARTLTEPGITRPASTVSRVRQVRRADRRSA